MFDITEGRKVIKLMSDGVSILVLFDNGDIFKHKKGEGLVSDLDRHCLGVISGKEYGEIVKAAAMREEIKDLNSLLTTAWSNYYQYGPEKGFMKPSKLPTAVEKRVSEINLSGIPGILLSYSTKVLPLLSK